MEGWIFSLGASHLRLGAPPLSRCSSPWKEKDQIGAFIHNDIHFTLCLLLREVSLREALHHSAIATGLLLLVLNVLPFRRQERERARAPAQNKRREQEEKANTRFSPLGSGVPSQAPARKVLGRYSGGTSSLVDRTYLYESISRGFFAFPGAGPP